MAPPPDPPAKLAPRDAVLIRRIRARMFAPWWAFALARMREIERSARRTARIDPAKALGSPQTAPRHP